MIRQHLLTRGFPYEQGTQYELPYAQRGNYTGPGRTAQHDTVVVN